MGLRKASSKGSFKAPHQGDLEGLERGLHDPRKPKLEPGTFADSRVTSQLVSKMVLKLTPKSVPEILSPTSKSRAASLAPVICCIQIFHGTKV